MAVERYKPAGNIILGAGRELGLGTVPDPYSSSDDNWIQLTQMLTSIGRELADTYVWDHLVRVHSFTTVASQSAYDLPADYLAIVDDTAWDATLQQPLSGPLTAQEWQQLQVSGFLAASSFGFRLSQNQIMLAPTGLIPDTRAITFEFRSLAWVRPAASGLGNGNTLGTSGADECVEAGDYPLFDPLLLHYALKLWWKKDKGFEVGTAEADFVRTLENAKGRGRGARTVTVGGRSSAFLSSRNLPWF